MEVDERRKEPASFALDDPGLGRACEVGRGAPADAGDDAAFDDDVDFVVEAPGGINGPNGREDDQIGRSLRHFVAPGEYHNSRVAG